jgi:hypothetical protein
MTELAVWVRKLAVGPQLADVAASGQGLGLT